MNTVHPSGINPTIITRLRSGDQSALSVIFDQFHRFIIFYARKFVDQGQADDVAADTFVSLWQNRNRIRDENHLRAFLYRCASNLCLDLIKTNRRRASREKSWTTAQPDFETGAIIEIIRTEFLRELSEEIERLPTQCRAVIRLAFLEGQSIKEIASQLSLSENTVKNHKANGLRLLRQRLQNPSLILLLAVLLK